MTGGDEGNRVKWRARFQNHAKKLPNVSSEILEKQRFSKLLLPAAAAVKQLEKIIPEGKHRASEGRASSEETGPKNWLTWLLKS